MNNQSVFITGGGGGIGLATAIRFSEAGWRVGLTDAQDTAVEQARAKLPGPHFFAVTDVCDADTLRETMGAFASPDGGKIDAVINNAGVLVDGAFQEIPLARQQSLVDVNVKGFLNCAYCAFEFLQRAPHGALINLGSASSECGVPQLAAYSASKFFVRGLSEALTIEWEETGIHVCEILPGLVKTNMTATATTPVFDAPNVNVDPDTVAEAIFRAATLRSHPKVRVDTRSGKLNRWLLRHLPLRAQRRIMRRIIRG